MKLPPAFTQPNQYVNVMIESPKGTANKYTFDQETELFKLGKILPQGMVFPLHFGFIPCTKGEDGDPPDVLLLMDEPSYPGCIIESRPVGIIEARQTERNGESMRNDRIIAPAIQSTRYAHVTLKNLKSQLVEIKNFFVNYNEMEGKIFKPLRNNGREKAIRLIKKSVIK